MTQTQIGTRTSRRSVLRFLGCTMACITGSAGGLSAIEPFERSKPGELKLSLAAYSMRKYLSLAESDPSAMNLMQFVDYCQQLGLPGAELTSYYFPKEFDQEYLRQLRRHCHLRGISISGGAIRNDYCQLPGEKLDQDLAHTRKWIEHYAFLGAPAIRIFAGDRPSGDSLESTLARCAEQCRLMSDYAAERGIFLALENHGGVTATAEGLLQIVRQVDSKGFGVNFDSGNFRSTDDPYEELRQIAPYAVNAQVKVDIYPGGVHQKTDLPRVLGILRDAGYSGWVALEYEAEEEPKEAIPRYVEQMQKLVG